MVEYYYRDDETKPTDVGETKPESFIITNPYPKEKAKPKLTRAQRRALERKLKKKPKNKFR